MENQKNNNFELSKFKCNQNYAIEASAGTGKTFNIVNIVEKLVNEEKIDLSKILIVTYTEKAAGELKDRIRQKLNGKNCNDASICTIHSFCQNAIAEFAVSAKLPRNLNTIKDEELNKYLEGYLRSKGILDKLEPYFDEKNFKYEELPEYLNELIKNYYLNERYEEDETIVSLDTSEVKEIFELKFDILKSSCIQDLFINHPEIKNNYEILLKYPDGKSNDFRIELESVYKNDFKFNGVKFKITKNWPENEEVKKAFSYFKELKEALNACNPNKNVSIDLLADAYIEIQRIKEINKLQTFNDMLRYVREAVISNDCQMKDKLRDKYRYAIIDEFQDTNQLQFDIFKNVFMCEGHNLIVVGDPKQSIYSFQGANVNVYLQAVKEINADGGNVRQLVKNWRSTPSMVNSCNKIFENFNFKNMEFNPSVPITEALDNKEHKALYDGKPVDAIWMIRRLEESAIAVSSTDQKAIKNLKTKKYIEAAVSAIIDCCSFNDNGNTRLMVTDKEGNFRNVSFKDFAFLARKKSEMPAIENVLRHSGIPYVRYKDDTLFKGKECADWIALLSVLSTSDLTGYNRMAFKKVLFTKFFGISLNNIADVKYDNDSTEEIKLIKKWRELALNRRWEDLVDDVIVESGIMDRMKSTSEIQALGMYKQIGNYCVDYLSQNHSIAELINKLKELSKGSSDDDENGAIVEKSTDFNCVQILTMHASKGLQYPVVISLSDYSPGKPGKVFSQDKEIDGIVKHRIGFDKSENDESELEEFKRLIYVAYTRPQFVLILSEDKEIDGNNQNKNFLANSINNFISNNSFKEISPTELDLKELKASVQKILKESSLDNNEDSNAKEAQDNVLKQIIKMSKEISSYKHSYTSLSHSKVENNEYDEEWNNTEGIELDGLSAFDKSAKQINTLVEEIENYCLLPDNYPRGSRCGTALHEIFERIDFTDYENNIEYIIKDSFINQGIKLDDELVSPTINMIDHVLNAKLPTIKGSNVGDDTFTLSSLTSADVKKELEFNFNLNNERLKNFFNGFIDLLFKHNGCYSILDWKSDKLNDDFISYCDNKEMKKHVDDTYSIQRVLYSYCLIKWLKCYYSDLSEEEIFNSYFGGIYYVFLRGCKKETGNGIYSQTWDSFDDLNNEFQNIMNHRIWRKSNE